ncbi:hypothetical protein B296_00009052 [Ensete ventricosum]|uniref:Uncharacterized protein n=1 Tax=Ensete ventricosum TaxID=4639 RepID=A0A426ZYB1_ENSVE|nr:hypothetical protein B296_00009052 [Ensete ventricosum]
MTHVKSTRHSCSRRNVHHAARTMDDMEAYDGMVSNNGIKGLKYERPLIHGIKAPAPLRSKGIRTRAKTNRAHSTDTEAQTMPTWRTRKISTNILALEGGPDVARTPTVKQSQGASRKDLNYPTCPRARRASLMRALVVHLGRSQAQATPWANYEPELHTSATYEPKLCTSVAHKPELRLGQLTSPSVTHKPKLRLRQVTSPSCAPRPLTSSSCAPRPLTNPSWAPRPLTSPSYALGNLRARVVHLSCSQARATPWASYEPKLCTSAT